MDVGVPELIIILVIILLLWGPGRLAKIGGELGTGIRAFRQGLGNEDKEEKEEPQPEAEDIQAAVPVAIEESRDGNGK